MLPEGAHDRESDFTIFFLQRDSPGLMESIQKVGFGANDSEYRDGEGKNFLYCLNVLKTVRDSSVDRGAILKSMAICSPYHFVDSFRQIVKAALDEYFKTPELVVLERLYSALNNCFPIMEVPCPTPDERLLMHRYLHVFYTSIFIVDHTFTYLTRFFLPSVILSSAFFRKICGCT